MRSRANVLLVGPEGTGKTVYGFRHAERHDYAFVDFDDLAGKAVFNGDRARYRELKLVAAAAEREASKPTTMQDQRLLRDGKRADEILRNVDRLAFDLIVRPPVSDRPLLCVTTFRPPFRHMLAERTTLRRFRLRWSLASNWLVVRLRRDLHEVADHFMAYPDQRVKRARIAHLASHEDILASLVHQNEELTSIYEDVLHGHPAWTEVALHGALAAAPDPDDTVRILDALHQVLTERPKNRWRSRVILSPPY